MDKSLHEPNFVLKPEYRLSEEEKAEYTHNLFRELYVSSLAQLPELPYETMSRLTVTHCRENRWQSY